MYRSILVPLIFAAFFFTAPSVWATVQIDWVKVRAAGNSCEPQSNSRFAGCYGGVAYPYRIGKFEVTNAQYAEFLNAVAATDTHGLWNPGMEFGGFRLFGITRSGSPGSFSYAPEPGGENKPVHTTTFFDAVRFANWLHNGQPQGLQDESTTEDGAYTLTPDGVASNSIERNPGAKVFVPSPSEWYKAAYYDPAAHRYFRFAAGSDDFMTCDVPGPTPNTANCDVFGDVFLTEWNPDVGSYTGSASPNGSFDQAGSVWEWHEGKICNGVGAPGTAHTRRGVAGEDFGSDDEIAGILIGVGRASSLPAFSRPADGRAIGQGFRVASLASEPIATDRDLDRVADAADNCPADPNADQANFDGDEFGDACDPYPENADDLGICLAVEAEQTAQQEQLELELETCLGEVAPRGHHPRRNAKERRGRPERKGERACRPRPAPHFVDVEWVTVGAAGNDCDPRVFNFPGCFGGVEYVYRIGKFEITNSQYSAFLNAVAAADTHGLYNRDMEGTRNGGPATITRSGKRECFRYEVAPGSENKPVTYVSFSDALRFANWLHNGQPQGPQGKGTTEDGAYSITSAGLATNSITRDAGATVFLTSENEWFKAAYYDAELDFYRSYPTSSNLAPTCSEPTATPNSANCKKLTNPDFRSGNATDVGSYTASPSPNGTFDQSGNVWEWTDTIYCAGRRGLKGESFLNFGGGGWNANFGGPSYEAQWEARDVGFRIASLTETPTADGDVDGRFDFQDNCPADPNTDQANVDGDAFGDACDPYPEQPDNLGSCTDTSARQGARLEKLVAKLDKCLRKLEAR